MQPFGWLLGFTLWCLSYFEQRSQREMSDNKPNFYFIGPEGAWEGDSFSDIRRQIEADPMCGDCKRHVEDDKFYTEVNPEGGHGRPQLLICDDCMTSGRWDDWKARTQ
jgi:hypothetical protein